MVTHAPWEAVPGLRHGFLGRPACAGADAWEPVVARAAGLALPVRTARQVHGARVVDAAACVARPEADAVVVGEAGVLVGVVTADCVPALLVAPRRRVAAAVHAGWRGAAAGVLDAAVAELGARFGIEPGELRACLGPSVGPCCYQVDAPVRDAFASRPGDPARDAFRPDVPGRWRLDVRAAARALLAAAGVADVHDIGPCTACDAGFCSVRRDGPGAGRQLSFVGWT